MIHRTWRAPMHSATQLRRNRDINTPSVKLAASKCRCFICVGHDVITTVANRRCNQKVVLVIQTNASLVRSVSVWKIQNYLELCIILRFRISGCCTRRPKLFERSWHPQEVIPGAMQRPRADLNRDRWIQSPEC